MEDMKKVLKELGSNLKKFAKEYPEQTNAFFGFLGAVEKQGALDKKTKELIAIALSVVQKCHWCIAYHVESALKEGATKDEIMESAYVAVLMGGGPALAYSQLVAKAVEDFKK